ncbi:FRG domain-containing protein [Peribacillus simplex]|uniref:FRG domain-containing protein n=1 Tax=Peribacillus simplex TaxID=1478 RepID=A0AAW7IDR1_9BACI|nr:FRG domain-containing protein [Peribacillus simplex]MDM5452152.1 FRG domain-containing protein [Peribacillus simplex]
MIETVETESEDTLFKLLNRVEQITRELRTSLKVSEENSIIAFRGEPQDYGETKLLPSLYRKKLSVIQEKKLFELLKDYNVIGNEEMSNLQKAIAAQHYLATSRLLDISFNVLVAIYFATSSNEEYKEKRDGYLYIFCLPQYFSPSSKYIEQYYDNMLLENNRQFILKKNFKVITHGYFNERVKLQRGGFIFFPASNITRIPECFYKKVKIHHEAKKIIRKQLTEFFSIYESSIFPEKDKTSEVIFEGVDKKNKDYNSVHSINFEREIYFDNLKYELDYYSLNKNKTETMRILRKYEQDFFTSLNGLEKQVSNDEETFKTLTDVRARAKHDFENLKNYAKKELEYVSR